MKLKTKIAGSLALPLALAVAANSAQAFTVVDNADQKVTIGGYLSAISNWNKTGNKQSAKNDKFNNGLSAGTSRLNIGYTDKETGTKFFYEQQFVGGAGVKGQANGLRHAFFETEDGIVGGHTWSFGTNLVALAETIDTDGNSNVSYQAYGPRNLLLGKKFKLDDGLSFGLALEDGRTGGGDRDTRAKSVIPSVVANFQGEFGDTKVFAAWTNYTQNLEPVDTDYLNDGANPKKGKDKRANRLTLGANIVATDALNVKLGLTQNFGLKYDKDDGKGKVEQINSMRNAKGTHVSAALGFKVNEKVRTNLVTEYSKWNKNAISKEGDGEKAGKAYRVWLNGFYQADNGVEWGVEYQLANIKADVDNYAAEAHDGNGLAHKGQAIRLQAKYAF